jgi:hypothetical protein
MSTPTSKKPKKHQIHTDASGTALKAIIYQEQDGFKKVISYASRGLTKSEKHYSPHKLEFLALKWTVCDKCKDYLYGTHSLCRRTTIPRPTCSQQQNSTPLGIYCSLPLLHLISTYYTAHERKMEMQMVSVFHRHI